MIVRLKSQSAEHFKRKLAYHSLLRYFGLSCLVTTILPLFRQRSARSTKACWQTDGELPCIYSSATADTDELSSPIAARLSLSFSVTLRYWCSFTVVVLLYLGLRMRFVPVQ